MCVFMLIIFKNSSGSSSCISISSSRSVTVSKQKKLKSEIKLNHSRTTIIQVTLNKKERNKSRDLSKNVYSKTMIDKNSGDQNLCMYNFFPLLEPKIIMSLFPSLYLCLLFSNAVSMKTIQCR
jgi:hypothetical protein